MKQFNLKEIKIDGERIFLKKNWIGWKVVNPYRIDGKINWKNLLIGGSWINLIVVMIMSLLLLGSIYEYYSLWKTATECLNNNNWMYFLNK